jgi:hypothetical protein
MDRDRAKTRAQKSLVENFSSSGVQRLVHLANIMPARIYAISSKWENARK